jgi:DNA-binding response OmpR family regulator
LNGLKGGSKMKFEVSGKVLWILEDHPSCQFIYKTLFASKNSLYFFPSINQLFTAIQSRQSSPDLLILDLQLPDGVLTDYLPQALIGDFIREVPTLVVSFLGEIRTMRSWYHEGVFDYVVKPFDSNELIVRLERLLRAKLRNTLLQKKLGLTATEEQIIELFCKSDDLILHKDALKAALWHRVQVVPKTFDVHMSNLRKKLLIIGYALQYVKNDTWKIEESARSKSLS